MFFEPFEVHLFLQVLTAAFLGALIGIERKYKRKEAGLKTFSLVALGSCLFTVLGIYLTSHSALFSTSQIDPVRIIQAIAIGIGFIGSGLIIYHKFQVEGLTTAAALWAAAGIGIAVGLELYLLAFLVALLTILILSIFRQLEERFF
jgi:putative Mg2+ transporter-C (MgtC) family protein